MTRIATFNVNSIKARMPNVLTWLDEFSPDIALFQEIKSTEETFPRMELEAAGYNIAISGQKSYNGVAIFSKTPLEVTQADRRNDRDVAAAMRRSFARYFDVPDTAEMRDGFYYFIEITDLMFSLSVVQHGKITPAMLREAKRAGAAYLATYK